MERSDTLPVEDNSVKQPWGKLTSITIRQPNIDLSESEYTFGRAKDNTIAIPDKRLSSQHCKIVREDDGKAYVVDLSTNGTFHENDKIGKGTKKELTSGDKVYLLHHSKVQQEDVLGYIFSYKDQDNSALKKLREEDVKALEEQKKLTEKQSKLADDLGEEMKCCICIDYIYQCVTLVPCLHNFCAACFSDWMKKSKVCPNCRADVSEVKKNSTINNIVEKFLNANPDKKRPQDEYDTMDKTNEIKTDRLSLKDFSKEQKKKKANRDYDDDDEEDEDEYDEDEDDDDEDEDEDDDDGVGNGRQCPECIQARPSDGFKCNPTNPAHLFCSSCYQPFPDRRTQFPQQCALCSQSYCNLYRACRNSTLGGRRLDYLESHRVQPMLQPMILRGNTYEVKVINDYLNQQRQTCVDVFNDFMKDPVDKGNFKYKINRSILQQVPPLQANTEIKMDRKTPVCTQCFEKVWFQIILQYRQSINSKLPQTIKDRPTCWYGINCRTMTHNSQHAQKLNHACEQTKF